MDLLTIAAFLLGWISERILDYLWSLYKKKFSLYRLRKKVEKNNVQKDLYPNITITAEGFPHFNLKGQFYTRLTEKKVNIAFPSEMKDKLFSLDGYENDKDIYLDYPNLTALGKALSVTNIQELIDSSRYEIAQKFVKREDGCLFNGKLFGIVNVDDYSRTVDDTENPILIMSMFETNYFTHRVLWDVTQKLKKSALLPLRNLQMSELNSKYNIFRTSIGLSLIVEIPYSNEILMTKRSTTASYSDGKQWIYVSVTETLSETDFDKYTNQINLWTWVERALIEELGLLNDTNCLYDKTSLKIYDMFFENNFYQDGITASIKLNRDVPFEKIKNLKGRDTKLEVANKFTIKATENNISQFIQSNQLNLREQTIFALKSYITRKSVSVDT